MAGKKSAAVGRHNAPDGAVGVKIAMLIKIHCCKL